MQKMVYLSNNRDFTEQGTVNENKYFVELNALLDEGWTVAQVTPNQIRVDDAQKPSQKETFVAFVLLEKPDE